MPVNVSHISYICVFVDEVISDLYHVREIYNWESAALSIKRRVKRKMTSHIVMYQYFKIKNGYKTAHSKNVKTM